MDRNRKILLSILLLMVLTIVIAIVDISLSIQEKNGTILPIQRLAIGPGIGVLRIEGPISMSSQSGPMGIMSGSDFIVKALDGMAENKNIKAIVLRINSPGGTVAATQEIYNKIIEVRRKHKKYIIASMGEVAASGGYYIAAGCDKIIANHGTITGSIGVIAMAPNLQGLFEKYGIKMNVIKSGKHKDIFSYHREMTSAEQDILQEMINKSFNKFLVDIARGRGMSIDDIKPHADGRIMGGETALKNKLIDGLGTYEDTLRIARREVKLQENAPVYESKPDLFQQLFMGIEGKFGMSTIIPQQWSENYFRIEYRYIQ